MKTVAGGLLLALVFFAAGTLALQESRHARRLAQAHERLATLNYTEEDDPAEATLLNRLPPPLGIDPAAETRHDATVDYWLARYTTLTDLTNPAGGPPPSDPELLLLAANAAFRTSAPQSQDRKAAVQRLDGVVQAYADVLRKDPSLSDAAYNYEFVVKLRDQVAKGPGKNARDAKKAPPKPEDVSVDLPAGPTIHGRPGGPPEGESMGDFKTVTPMRYDEREEQMDPGRGQKIQRKG
jgi:hypothetical protein